MRLPRSVRSAEPGGKRVLVRADLNVPLEGGRVADDTRIRESLPTLELLLRNGATEVNVCSHLGRPNGPDPAFSMEPVAEHIRYLLPDERIRVLENTRFNPGETKNDPEFAWELASHGDLYVNDAFGSAHRAHASTEGVAHLLPAYAGLLMERELEALGRLLDDVERPFVLVTGGAKVEDKLGVLEHLGGRADTVLVGGKMAEQIRGENPLSFPVELPVDVVAAASFDADAEARVTPTTRCRKAGSDWTSGLRPEAPSGAGSSRPAPCSGTGRWASSSGRGSPRARRPSPRRWPRVPATRSWAAATPCARSRSSALPTRCRGSRPAAARRSSCSRARSCPAWRPFPLSPEWLRVGAC